MGLRFLSLLVVTAASALPAQTVWTVDDDGGADFTLIQPAVDAASSGDVILVRAGIYNEFTLAGKGVAILADQDADVFVFAMAGSIKTTVRDIPAGEQAVLRGLVFQPPLDIDEEMLVIEDNAGVVWLEEVRVLSIQPFPFFYFLGQNSNVAITNSERVVLVDSELLGAHGGQQGQGLEAGSMALLATNSTVFAHGTRFVSGGTAVLGGPGRSAVDVRGGRLVLRDCTAQGAGGGAGGFFGMLPDPGNGGPGLTLSAGAEVWSIGTDLLGGPGGTRAFGGGMGMVGPPFVNQGGALNEDPDAEAAQLRASRVVRDDVIDDDVRLVLQTEPDSSAFLLVRLFSADPFFIGSLPGFSGVGAAPIALPAGVTDGQGQLSIEIGIPTLPPGLTTWNATAQMVVTTPTPRLELSNPSIFTIVDEQF
ncbi:MAG: hypothetical protein AAF628_09875 [Planctomycetota bacterium]